MTLTPGKVIWIAIGVLSTAYGLLCQYAYHAPKLEIVAQEGKEFQFTVFRLKDQHILVRSYLSGEALNHVFLKNKHTQSTSEPTSDRADTVVDHLARNENQARGLISFSFDIDGQEPIEFTSAWGGNPSSLNFIRTEKTSNALLKQGLNHITIKIRKIHPGIAGMNMVLSLAEHNGLKQDNDPIPGIGPFSGSINLLFLLFYILTSTLLICTRPEKQ